MQSIGFFEDKAYLVVNNSNKIEVVDRRSFQRLATITEGINQPRYIAFSNDKFFVSNAASKAITVYSVQTNEYLCSISSGNLPVEQIVAVGDKVFVMLASWGSGNSVMVIDALHNTVRNIINLADNLQCISAYNNKIYALCSQDNHSEIQEIDVDIEAVTNIWHTDIYRVGTKLAVYEDVIYCVANTNQIFAMPISALTMPENPIFTVEENGFSTCYGFNIIDGVMLIADAQGFINPALTNAYLLLTCVPLWAIHWKGV